MKEVVHLLSKISGIKKAQIQEIAENFNSDNIEELTCSYIKAFSANAKIDKGLLEKLIERYKKISDIHEQNSIGYVTFLDEEYPDVLRQISSAPKVLYYKGDIKLLKNEKNIGVVGSRKPTDYGKWATKALVKDLVLNDFCIVSGFAGGIDSCSHKAAIENNGKTICIFGTPITKIYPANNRRLYDDVLFSGGLIISEHDATEQTHPAFFALRNRIISGLSSGLLIVEAGVKSGTLITARYALDQGKYIFAVPGNINSINSQGTNMLIKDGAVMTTSVTDILFEYGYRPETANVKAKEESHEDLSIDEQKIYELVRTYGQCTAEKIAINSDLKIQDILAILNILDIKGYILYDGFMATYFTR